MSDPLTLKHAAFHYIKYAGEIAAICEKLEHENEQEEARELAREFLAKRYENDHVEVTYDRIIQKLQEVADAATDLSEYVVFPDSEEAET